ncbi:MAG: hypothetical protein AAGD35_03745 [Actinomycetota bacterium]
MLTDRATTETAQVPGGRLARVLRIEWLGQTIAAVCWILSVVVEGVDGLGDWLQLVAAGAWLAANIAAVTTADR